MYLIIPKKRKNEAHRVVFIPIMLCFVMKARVIMPCIFLVIPVFSCILTSFLYFPIICQKIIYFLYFIRCLAVLYYYSLNKSVFLNACYASANFRGLEALCGNIRIHEENSLKYGESINYDKTMHLLYSRTKVGDTMYLS